ncbi:hypothetical protein EYF80_025581 [Liparis tanakae]|uniref:Uncharacterized protein n=1 Tax=Liparis tanakae TaxID=230148 RepID=A0A4Z2HGX9_9TELE|nr:hypothetical protein EYF80_025581 [Liparis tanakae]
MEKKKKALDIFVVRQAAASSVHAALGPSPSRVEVDPSARATCLSAEVIAAPRDAFTLAHEISVCSRYTATAISSTETEGWGGPPTEHMQTACGRMHRYSPTPPDDGTGLENQGDSLSRESRRGIR